RIATGAERNALMSRGQKSASPQRRPTARTARSGFEHDKTRQILRLAADAVGDPRADARPSESRRPGIHETLRRTVIEIFRGDAREERKIVHDAADVGQQLGDMLSGLPVLLELAARSEKLGRLLGERIHEREALALKQGFGCGLAIVLLQD